MSVFHTPIIMHTSLNLFSKLHVCSEHIDIPHTAHAPECIHCFHVATPFVRKGYSHLIKRGTPLTENRGNPHPSWEDYPRFLTKGVPLFIKWEYPFRTNGSTSGFSSLALDRPAVHDRLDLLVGHGRHALLGRLATRTDLAEVEDDANDNDAVGRHHGND